MAFVSVPAADIVAGKPIDTDLKTLEKNNFDYLNGVIGTLAAGDIPNGDFEIDSDSDGLPDSWATTTYPGGTIAFETTSPLNGAQSLKFTHPGGAGNGGGYADSDYMATSDTANFGLSFIHSATASTMKNQVLIRWFTAAKVFISNTTIYDSILNPASATTFHGVGHPPATASFFKVRLVGGENSVDVAGVATFDAVHLTSEMQRTQTVTSPVTSIVFTDIQKSKLLRLSYIGAVETSVVLTIRVSADNGATWLTSLSYFIAVADSTSTSALTGILLGASLANSPRSGEVTILGLGEAGYTAFNISTQTREATPSLINRSGGGIVNTTTAYNAIQILVPAGSITAGIFNLQEIY